jgi:hypothetical protein
MKLDTIDFRDADLSGLSINPDDRILDVCHSVMNNELTVTVMYSTGQLVNYCFSDINCLSQYSIKIRGTINGREYKNFISFDDGELIYSDKNIYSTTKDKVVYKMKPENQLLCLNQQYAIVKMGSAVNIVVHDKYKQHHISGILQSEYNTICVIALNLYLTVRNQQLVLHKNDEIVPIIDLNANYECFSAYKESQKDIICIYVKYKDDIQKILYDFNKSKLEFSSLGLEKQFTCNKIVSVTESVLLCIADDIVYVFNPLADKYNIIELQTKVKCQNLILENEDGSQRVKGDKEYRILKEAEE